MANQSILAAFERMWQHVVAALGSKSDISHNHTVASITDLTVTATELNYMDGVTSSVQGQLDNMATKTYVEELIGDIENGTY